MMESYDISALHKSEWRQFDMHFDVREGDYIIVYDIAKALVASGKFVKVRVVGTKQVDINFSDGES